MIAENTVGKKKMAYLGKKKLNRHKILEWLPGEVRLPLRNREKKIAIHCELMQ